MTDAETIQHLLQRLQVLEQVQASNQAAQTDTTILPRPNATDMLPSPALLAALPEMQKGLLPERSRRERTSYILTGLSIQCTTAVFTSIKHGRWGWCVYQTI